MAYCHGSESPYGCGHHDEHVRYARLGWLRRRRGHKFEGSHEQRHFELATGVRARHAHTHRSHSGSVLFRNERNGKWFELPHAEFKSLVGVGRDIEREARFNERARKVIEADERKRAAHEQRHRQEQERIAHRMARAEYSEVARAIRRAGGVNGQSLRAEVHDIIPTSLRARKGQGVSLDRARESVMEHMPWLNLHTETDLLDFMDRARTRRQHSAYRHKHAA